MRAQSRRVRTPAPKVISIDEISIRKGQTSRIVVSDLLRRGSSWFGGTDRSQASLAPTHPRNLHRDKTRCRNAR